MNTDLIGPRLYNGPMNLGLSTFYHIIFLRIGSLVFLYLTWCWGTIRTQNWQSQLFGGEILAWPKVNQKVQNHPICPFVCYYRIFLRVGSLAFFIFCMKLRDHKYSKLTEPIFLGKFSFAWKQAKKAQIDLICVVIHYYLFFSGLVHWFWYFAWSGGTMNSQYWQNWIWENPSLPESKPKGPKWPNLSIFLLLQHFSQD